MWTQARTRCLVCRVLALWIAGVVAFMLGVTVLILLLAPKARATDNGQYQDAAPEIRSWFKAQKSRAGVPCCDITDGHRTTWRSGNGGYEVPIQGEWIPVPPEAIIYNSGNPTGEAVVWYTYFSGKAFIRCFVPGEGV